MDETILSNAEHCLAEAVRRGARPAAMTLSDFVAELLRREIAAKKR